MAAAERKHQVPVLGAQGQVPKEEARIHEDAQFEYLNDLSPMLDVAGPGAKGYTFPIQQGENTGRHARGDGIDLSPIFTQY